MKRSIKMFGAALMTLGMMAGFVPASLVHADELNVEIKSNVTDVEWGTSQFLAAEMPTEVNIKGTIGENSQAWYYFTTDDSEDDITYKITLSNCTLGSKYAGLKLLNEDGELIASFQDKSNTFPDTCEVKLSPDTTYYLSVGHYYDNWNYASKGIDYVFTVKNADVNPLAGTLLDEDEIPQIEEQVTPGGNGYFAGAIPIKQNIIGTAVEDFRSYYCFRTGGTEASEYKITFANNTMGTKYIGCRLMDKYGNSLGEGLAKSNSGVKTISATLEPNELYYLYVAHVYDNWNYASGSTEYGIIVKGIEP